MNGRLYAAHAEITDSDERRALAERFDAELAELMGRPYEDDRHGTIRRHRKSYKREKDYQMVFLRGEGLFPDSNGAEKVIRRIIPVWMDGGGNRTDEGGQGQLHTACHNGHGLHPRGKASLFIWCSPCRGPVEA